MAYSVKNPCSLVLLAMALSLVSPTSSVLGAPVGIVQSWDLLTAVSDFTTSGTQNNFQSTTLVQTPLSITQLGQIGNSSSQTYLNIVIDDHHLVMVVQPDQYCIRESTHQSLCLSSGTVIIAPTQDVTVAFTGSYTYQLVGDPTSMGASISISKILPSGGQVIIGQGITRNSLFGPLSGNQNFSGSAVLPAGSQYRVRYQFISDAADPTLPIGSHVTGSGAFQINVHPVPEPATVGSLAFATLLLRKRGRRERH